MRACTYRSWRPIAEDTVFMGSASRTITPHSAKILVHHPPPYDIHQQAVSIPSIKTVTTSEADRQTTGRPPTEAGLYRMVECFGNPTKGWYQPGRSSIPTTRFPPYMN